MAVFIKVSKDGNYLYYLKTLFNNTISENEFIQRANMTSTDDFLKKYSDKLNENVKDTINRIRKISNMQLSALGFVEIKSNFLYFAGDETFEGEDKEKVKEEAIEYARRFYAGDESKIALVNSNKVTCFAKTKPISFEEYKSLMSELEDLTKIMCIKKEYIKKNSR